MTVYIGSNKVKDIGSTGVYLGSQNTNCLTYTPKNINLTLDPLNVTVVGSPTASNGVVSGFSTSNYLIFNGTGTVPANNLNSFEIAVKVTTPTTWTSSGRVINPTNGADSTTAPFIQVINSGAELAWYNGTTYISNFIAITLSSNTIYWFKWVYDGSTIKSYYSTNGSDYTLSSTITPSYKPYFNSTEMGIGCRVSDKYSSCVWNGSVDLKETYIKVNDSIWWKGGTGILTLKAGSKVYVPNGKNADGSNKFDEVVIANDLSTTRKANIQEMYFVSKGGATFNQWLYVYSGTSAPTGYSGNYAIWYDITNNLVKRTTDGGSTWVSGFSLPVCLATSNTASITSIDQVFDWCGYIGSTAFVLPGVKGLIPNGFNADGTYKSIEFETDRVLIDTVTSGEFNRPVKYFLFDSGLNSWGSSNNNVVYLDTRPSVAPTTYCTAYIKDENRWIRCTSTTTWTEELNYFKVAESVTASSGTITSLTPYTAQPLTTVIPVNAIYNGSQKVYEYNPYDPEHIFVNSAGKKTLTVTLKKGVYYVDITGGGAAMRYGYYYACFMNGGGSGASCYGEFYNPKEQTFTLYAGGGGSSAVKGVDSYMNIGSTRIITAGGGNQCHANGSCSGNTGGTGTLDFSSGLIENISVIARTGNAGSYTASGAPAAAASVSPHGFGAGGTGSACAEGKNTAGGIYLKYVRAYK